MIKKHGMSSTKASRVKKVGHRKEAAFADCINGEVISGHYKKDVKDCNGNYHSVKGGGEIKGSDEGKGKWQIFLYNINKFKDNSKFKGSDIFIKILETFPESYNDYKHNKIDTKKKIEPHMKKLKILLSNEETERRFLKRSFFGTNKKVKYLVIHHFDMFYVFDSKETIDVFVNHLVIDNSSTFQKVVFKYDDAIAAEIEVRTTNDGKYPSILFNMLKLKACKILHENIALSEQIKPNLRVYGKALETDFWTR